MHPMTPWLLIQNKESHLRQGTLNATMANEKVITQRHCYKRKVDAKNSQPESRAVGNFVADENASDEVALKSSLKCNEDNWWIDSGASQHMTHNKKEFSNYFKFEELVHVKLADNSVLQYHGKGSVHLAVNNGDEKVNIVLKDMLYVPRLQNKLFSLPSVIEKGVTVQFKGKKGEIVIDEKSSTLDINTGSCTN